MWRFCICLFISVLPLRRGGRLRPPLLFKLCHIFPISSQDLNFHWHYLMSRTFCVQWLDLNESCSFSWYWWNCWPSLLKIFLVMDIFNRWPKICSAFLNHNPFTWLWHFLNFNLTTCFKCSVFVNCVCPFFLHFLQWFCCFRFLLIYGFWSGLVIF